eukprot:gb/GECG01005945.1/.p1 GENE.gb/GECG01005945.1/~~gb/GECG01005945.1/.p1  ORF type:complete len:300 (+),score=39.98 gb/GECG01005945.1/:1-900(+)
MSSSSSSSPSAAGTSPAARVVGSLGSSTTGGIHIDRGNWVITTKKTHISEHESIERIREAIGFDPPEMIFGYNYLNFKNKETGVELEFNAVDALKDVLPPSAAPVRVAVAEEWEQNRDKSIQAAAAAEQVQYNHDWTFTSTYRGTIKLNGTPNEECVHSTKKCIDYEALKDTSIPIDAYDEVDLFESELDDSGTSKYDVRIRCMPDKAYALARFWLRVDGVMLRAHETRVLCEYWDNYLIREYSERQSKDWDSVRTLGLTTAAVDPNVASKKLPYKSVSCRGEKAVIVETIESASSSDP